jgi:hypothetical protein
MIWGGTIVKRIVALFIGVLLCCFVLYAATSPERTQGISIHMLPKRVAEIGGRPWGFTVDYSPRLKAESQQPSIQTVANLLLYVRKQDAVVQENGLWIVTTHPDAYSDAEKALLEEVKSLCRKEKIPLFICRGSELPNGWKRYDQ